MRPNFTYRRRIQFAETDLAGVLHFSNYFRLMEEVEHAFFRSLGTSVISEAAGVTVSWPRVAAECEYHAPIRFEDEVELSLHLTHVGNKALSYEVSFSVGGEVVAAGKITAICCSAGPNGAFKSMPIPEALRARLTAAS